MRRLEMVKKSKNIKKGTGVLFACATMLFMSLSVLGADEVTEPTMSKGTGVYDNSFDLTLSADEGTTIYYTLDGSNPINSETRLTYTDAINIHDRSNEANYVSAVDPALFDCAYATYSQGVMGDKYAAPKDSDVDKATVVKAVAFDGEETYSSVVTNTYFVGKITDHIKGIKESAAAAGIPVSIMSISVDYDDLFDYEKGIYVKGKIFDDAFASVPSSEKNNNIIVDATRKLPANYNQKGKEWERAAHIDYLESDGLTTSCILQQDCGIRIQGNYSRSDIQKSFRLYARKDYGAKNFKYKFFADAKDDNGEVLDKYKKLVLRNGGNGSFYGKYRDAYWQTVFKELGCDTLGSRVCVVYLDGEYWGIYILQEDYGDDYAESHHGVNKDNVVTIKGDAEKNACGYEMDDGTLPEGVTDETYYMHEVMNFFETHESCVKKEDYDALAQLVDPDSCMNYFVGEVYANNKWDWPGKNWYIWKTTEGYDGTNVNTDGRWRFVFCDLDFGGWYGTSERSDNTIKNSGLLNRNSENPIVLMFAYFMTNEDFRNRFNERLNGVTGNEIDADGALELAKQYGNIYGPLLEQFYNRYMGNKVSGGSDVKGFLDNEKNIATSIGGFAKYRPYAFSNIVSYINAELKDFVDKDSEEGNKEETSENDNKKDDDKDSDNETVSAPKAGEKVKDKKYIYKVVKTGSADGTVGSVSVVGLNKKTLRTVKIAATVTIGGIKYKVVSVGNNAFKGNKKITKVYIGKNIKTIGKYAFAKCKKIKRIVITSTVLKKVKKNAFKGTKKSMVIKVPKAKKKAYKKLIKKSGCKAKVK